MVHEFKIIIDDGYSNDSPESIISRLDNILSILVNDSRDLYSYNIRITPIGIDSNKSDDLFDKWWELYGKKVGRKKSLAKWSRLSMKDKMECLRVVGDYVKSTPDVKFRKDPLTYLNGECWNDDIISGHSQNGGIDVGIILHDSKNKDYGKGAW